jgi:hypothetical protein
MVTKNPTAPSSPRGKLELTWTNKHLRLIDDLDGSYDWVEPSDWRVAEVRLLEDVETVGDVHPDKQRAKDNLNRPGFGGGSVHWIPTGWLVSVW